MYLAGVDSSGKLEYIAIVACRTDKLGDVFSALSLRPGFHMSKRSRATKRKVASAFIKAAGEMSYLKTLCIRASINRLAEDLSHKYRVPFTKALNRVRHLCQKKFLKLLKRLDVREIHYDHELGPLMEGFQGKKMPKGPAMTLADILAWINLRRSDLSIDEPEAIIFIDLERELHKRLGL